MKKKILIILILVLIFTTGCTADYTLKYENGTFTEIINVRGQNEDQGHPSYEAIKNNGYKADIDGIEDFILDEKSTEFDVTLKHQLKNVKLNQLKAITECFTLNTYKETDNSYYLSLYGDFICQNLTNSTFTLETSEKVTIHNAHRVEKNKYIWDLEEEKITKDGIIFQIIQTKEKNINIGSDTMLSTTSKIVISFIIIGVGIGLYFVLKRVNQR